MSQNGTWYPQHFHRNQTSGAGEEGGDNENHFTPKGMWV